MNERQQKSFSAVILAGGKSRRMRQDKALIQFNGIPLVQKLAITVKVLGPDELFISVSVDNIYRMVGATQVVDKYPDAGPLAGIHSALSICRSRLLLVLAVDMPAMTIEFLEWLLKSSSGDTGIVPKMGGEVEPLVAIYPVSALPIATELLENGIKKASEFATRCAERQLVEYAEVPQKLERCLVNINTPKELQSYRDKIALSQ